MKTSTIDGVIATATGLPFSGVVLAQKRDKPLALRSPTPCTLASGWHLGARMLVPHLETQEHLDLCYGYGVWLRRSGQGIESYYVEGEDPGVQFVSATYPQSGAQIAMLGNSDLDIIPLFRKIEELALSY